MKKIKTWDFVLTKDIDLKHDEVWPLFLIIGVNKNDLSDEIVYTGFPIHIEKDQTVIYFEIVKILPSDVITVFGESSHSKVPYQMAIDDLFNTFLSMNPEGLVGSNISSSDLIPLESRDAVVPLFDNILHKKDDMGNVDSKYIHDHFSQIESLSYRGIDNTIKDECFDILKDLESSLGGIQAFSELIDIPRMTIMRVHSNLSSHSKWWV